MLVGSPTISPQIRSFIENVFVGVDVNRYDPVHLIAKGAALFARSKFRGEKLMFEPILNKTYGLKMGVDGKEKVCNIIYNI